MTKLSKKVMSLAIATFVTVSSAFGGNVNTAKAAETTQTETTWTVHFKMPSKWKTSQAPRVYTYYTIPGAGATKEDGTKEDLFVRDTWPGNEMTKENSDGWYSAKVSSKTNYTKVIFTSGVTNTGKLETDAFGKEVYNYTVDYRTPEEKDSKGNYIEGYKITSDVWFDADTMTQPSTTKPGTVTTSTPSTSTPAPTITGPQVKPSVADGTVFYEDGKTDSMDVKISLAEGAKSATYSIDNGPETTITADTTIKIGQGALPGSTFTLTVKSTDGKTTNTQTFTYTKGIAKEVPVHFSVPAGWPADTDHTVYIYAYYNVTENGETTPKYPLGYWPGTKATKDANGYYTANIPTDAINASDSKTVHVMLANIKGKVGTELKPNLTIKDTYYYECTTANKIPCVLDKDGNPSVDADAPGYEVSQETWFTPALEGTLKAETKATASTVNPNPTLSAYFGTEKTSPQYTTTKQKLSAVALNATGSVTYTFAVDGKEIYSGKESSTTWDPSALAAGTHKLTATVKDSKKTVTLEKTYVLLKETTTPSATPSTVPSTGPSIVPSTTPVVTASAIPTVTPTAVATVTPTALPTVMPTAVVITPTAVPTVTPTAVATSTPTAIPTIEPTAVIVPTPELPNATVTTPVALTGTLTLPKAGKTAGETLTIKAKGKKGTPSYKYTYYIIKGSKKTKLASNTTKTSVKWTPSKSGTYKVRVVIKDAAKKTKTITKTYKVKARVITIKSFKTSKKSGQKVKTKITLTAKATTKKGKVSYKFAVQKGSGTIKTIKSYSSKNKKVWKPTKKGTYKLYVYVKNGKGVVVSKSKKFVVK